MHDVIRGHAVVNISEFAIEFTKKPLQNLGTKK